VDGRRRRRRPHAADRQTHAPRDRRALWPLTWLAATVVAFSLLPMKKNAYLLPRCRRRRW
jgi:hypothetical protein